MIVHHSSSRDLDIRGAVIEDGKIVAGAVINGGWWWKLEPDGTESAYRTRTSTTPVTANIPARPNDWVISKDTQ